MSSKVNQATMETVQESMGEAYESLQALKKLVSSYAKNSDVLRSLNDVLQELKTDIKGTNEIYKHDEKNIKNLLDQVSGITNEQKHISMQIPLIIKQLDQNETIKVMKSLDEKANEYQENLNQTIFKINDIFNSHFTKWNNSTSHLEYSNYVNEIKNIKQDIILSFKNLDLTHLNNSLMSGFDIFNKDIKDIKGIFEIQSGKLENIENSNTNLNVKILDGFNETQGKIHENLEYITNLNLKENLERNQQFLNTFSEKKSLSITKIEESISSLKFKFESKVLDLENKIESLEKKVLSIEKVQGESLNRISDLLNSMEENQKIIIEQTKKKGWFS